ncbi:uncharacterized protein [Diabrotica undecimpunctata]|uniref:uncharacterized protein isoform X1 n=1 Tax=Diabrotica undecimpunctata TaxID=50387 RepID=UPI003B638F7F
MSCEANYGRCTGKLRGVYVTMKLCSLVGIVSTNPKCRAYKMYVLFLIVGSIAAWIHSAYEKNHNMFGKYTIYMLIADQISSFFLCMATVAVSITSVFLFPEKFLQTVQSLRNFDRILGISCPLELKHYLIFFGLGHLLILIPIMFDAWTWISNLGFRFYSIYVIRNIQYYQLSVILFLWFWLAMEVIKRFKILNAILEKVVVSPYILLNTDLKRGRYSNCVDVFKMEEKIKNISGLYNGVCDVVDLMNDVFGKGLLFIIIFIISFILTYMILLIIYISFPINGVELSKNSPVVSGVWILENFIKIMALASAGENLSREANRTITVCYGIINTLDNNPQYNVDAIKEELNFLIQQAAHRKPCLSASGFFVANSTMMGFIIGSITSYVIVAVQFLKETSP